MNFGLHGKISILLAALSIIVFAAVGLFNIFHVNKIIESRTRAKMETVLGIVARDRYQFSEPFLNHLKKYIHADILMRQKNQLPPEYSTFDSKDRRVIFSRLENMQSPPELLDRVSFADLGYYVVGGRAEASQDQRGMPRDPTETWTSRDVFLFFPKAEIDREVREVILPILVMSGIGFGMILIFGALLAQTIVKPLKILSAAASKVQGGDLSRTVDIHRGDEIGRLANSFNSMVEGLRRVQEQLVQTEKLAAMGQLATGIAHEIKNPLASIRMTAQVLEERMNQDKNSEGLRIILSEIDRLAKYVDGLLTYAKPQPVSPEPGILNESIRQVLGIMEKQLKHLSITVELELDPKLDPGSAGLKVFFDSNQLKQVVMNLVLNAAQVTPRGGKVGLKTLWMDEGRLWRIEVWDQGPGIPQELRSRIFEPFMTTKEGGTGLGLAICKSIIQEHKGRIGFDSGPKGTTFWVEAGGGKT